MIGRLRGVVLVKQAQELLLDVQGVGYELLVPLLTAFQLPDIGDEAVLHTHLVVREDAHSLYGFASLRERALFRELIRVNGVGPRLALTILSGIDTDDFVRSVRDGDSAALVRLPGVGKKTAERLLVEMRDRLADWQVDGQPLATDAGAIARDGHLAEAEAALVALGYKPQEAARAIAAADAQEPGRDSETLIRQALRNMVRR